MSLQLAVVAARKRRWWTALSGILALLVAWSYIRRPVHLMRHSEFDPFSDTQPSWHEMSAMTGATFMPAVEPGASLPVDTAANPS